MREHIGPLDQLPNGTKVRVGNKRGVIVSSVYVPAVPSGMIYIHTVKLTEKYTGNNLHRYKWESIKPQVLTVGYCSIFVEEAS